MLELRDYQQRIIHEIREHMKCGTKKILVTAPTGSGKTVLTAFLMKSSMKKHRTSMIVVHRRELVEQTVQTLRNVGINPNVVAAGQDVTTNSLVTVASIQTLAQRLQRVSRPSLIIWDECHHIAAASWSKIYREYADAYHLGLSATPIRLDGRGLGDYFDVIVRGPDVRSLIDCGYLSDYRLFAPSDVNMRGAKKSMGDWSRKDSAERVDRPKITGDVISHYKKYCNGKRAIIFCVNVAHSEHVAQQFNEAGITTAHLDGGSSERERQEIMHKFREGGLRCVSNVDLFGEGLDIPGIEAAILLRPTQSTGLYMQQVGRALRPADGKPYAIILDHVGNCGRHGLPCDRRDFSLQGLPASKKRDASAPGVRVCGTCFAANRASAPVCDYCGESLRQFREVAVRGGELTEVTDSEPRERFSDARRKARSYTELVELGKSRGMKNPTGWAYMIMKARNERYW